jgi:hypothetical protein
MYSWIFKSDLRSKILKIILFHYFPSVFPLPAFSLKKNKCNQCSSPPQQSVPTWSKKEKSHIKDVFRFGDVVQAI